MMVQINHKLRQTLEREQNGEDKIKWKKYNSRIEDDNSSKNNGQKDKIKVTPTVNFETKKKKDQTDRSCFNRRSREEKYSSS